MHLKSEEPQKVDRTFLYTGETIFLTLEFRLEKMREEGNPLYFDFSGDEAFITKALLNIKPGLSRGDVAGIMQPVLETLVRGKLSLRKARFLEQYLQGWDLITKEDLGIDEFDEDC
ncbi:MAG: hypothetical protein Q7R81_06205 [Candidatus Peregrinibacteria bacterium]|nr:hypothetical protein [Candidatus Peregrinibacteria bacterium]